MKQIIFSLLLLFTATNIIAQNTSNNTPQTTPISPNKNSTKVKIAYCHKAREINPITAENVKDLHFRLKNKKGFNEVEDDLETKAIKEWKNKLRKEGRDSVLNLKNPIPVGGIINPNVRTTAAPSIFLNHNFSSANDAAYIPNDNSVAVSNSGIVISTTNSTINMQDSLGNFLITSLSLNSFLGIPTASGDYAYDAKMIYDDVLDRFFLVVLQGSTPSTSELIVATPETSNPLGSWWVNTFPASDVSSGVWMDYPSIGINDSSLYVTINAFNSSNSYQYPIIFRIPKAGLGSGSTFSYQYDSNPLDNASNKGFTICPLSYGQFGLYGHTMGFVSTVLGGGDYVQFWTWDIATGLLTGQEISSSSYQIGSDAAQLGTTDLLDVGNCRVKDGFLIYNTGTTDWNIYFAFTSISSASATHNYIIKAKIVWNSSGVSIPSGSWTAYGNTAGDLCYPSIASLGVNSNDDNVLMSYDATFSTNYPYYEVVASDVSNNFSSNLLIYGGDGYINDYDSDNGKYRWGDYTHLARKLNTGTRPIVWSTGCYGLSDNNAGTWIGEISTSHFPITSSTVSNAIKQNPLNRIYPNPAKIDFTVEFNTDKEGLCTIQLNSIDGRVQMQLLNGNIPDGGHQIQLSTKDLESGNYIVSISLDGQLLKSEKLVVLKN